MHHAIFILFLFACGACAGSFLNVVVWRLPREQSLVYPPSRCPKCETRLAWYDNIPVFGWLMLGGQCRYCKQPISPRYPIVEFVTGALFVLYYVVFFIVQQGPCPPRPIIRPLSLQADWPIYGLYMFMIASLLAASLIDAELFIIPIEIPWLMAGIGVVVHAIIDRPTVPGALSATPAVAAMAAGGAVGLVISILLLRRGIIPLSFAEGAPPMEHEKEQLKRQLERDVPAPSLNHDPAQPTSTSEHLREYSRAEIRAEMRKEMTFLIPPMLLAALWCIVCLTVPPVARIWERATSYHWVGGMFGAIFGALIGGLTVWVTRILGSIAFGREAMGMGDVHLMFGVGAIVGAGASVVAFFIAPFCGAAVALYMLFSGKRREIPYGPYLSMATAIVVIWYCDIAAALAPGLQGMGIMLRNLIGGGGGGGGAGSPETMG
jgi:leader peptidase (prepilin peptidase)/N-methyltransferase